MYITTFTVGQEAVSRYYAARDGRTAQKGSVIAAIINFIYGFIPATLGVIVLALINMGVFDAAQFQSVGSRYALPVLAVTAMPPLVCGILFAGVVSATMSSASSDLLGAGSIFANDIYRQYIKTEATDEEVMKVAKIVMVLAGLLSSSLLCSIHRVSLRFSCFPSLSALPVPFSRMSWGCTGKVRPLPVRWHRSLPGLSS